MPPEIKKSTLLHEVVCEGDYAKVESLLQSGYSANAQNEAGDTPLHLAIRYGRYDAVPILIKYGADLWIENDKIDTPLCEAIAQKNSQTCVDMLVLTGVLKNEPAFDPKVHQYFIEDTKVNIEQYLHHTPKRKLKEANTENVQNKRIRRE